MAAVALTAAFVAQAIGGHLAAGSDRTTFAAVSIDSRTIGPDMLFVAIRGDRVDGHDYIDDALGRGATGVITARRFDAPPGVAVVVVDDTVAALQALGREVRRRSQARVVAITGSAGKTSTKELIAELLAARYRVMRNRGNLNNHIGLPLSLTELAAGPDIAVVELGMNHAGEIRTLVGLAQPDVRVWTNVGDAHIGHFGSREAVARAKAEVLELASADTVAVVNADDPLVMAHTAGFPGRVVTFGLSPSAEVRASRVEDRGFDGLRADIDTAAGRIPVEASLPGRAHLMNVLAAVAVALEFGVPVPAMVSRLRTAVAVPRRGTLVTLRSGARLIDDSYNASPAATDAMLQALAATPAAGRRVAVLGEMLELGDAAAALHESCGRSAARSGVDLLVAVGGPAADGLIAGAVAAGLAADRTRRYPDSASACAPVAALVRAGDVVLVKGSRGTRMDVIADALQAGGTA
jgi:UDP-N-acetylmuramoyl-tripeptide--D-alanyl-D-alanine ligase